MASKVTIDTLEEEERRRRTRLSAYRAKVLSRLAAPPMMIDQRLRRLERQWKLSAERLQHARRGQQR